MYKEKNHQLSSQKRTILGKKVKTLRKNHILPANVFGQSASIAVQVDEKEFSQMLHKVGETGIVYLQIDKEHTPRPVLISSVSVHPVSGDMLHVDFQQVNLSEEITANIPLELEGESEAVKAGGVLLKLRDEIEVKALPTNLPEKFVLNIGVLTEVGQELKISDLQYNKDEIIVQLELDEVLVLVQEQQEEEEAPEEATPEEIEITGGGKPKEDGEEAEQKPSGEEEPHGKKAEENAKKEK